MDEAGIAQISKIYVTGHSLGGALANYSAADLAILLKAKYSFTNRNVLKMINFGAPYSANDAFYDFFTNGLASSLTSVAVINEKDVVPYISVPIYLWRRLGTPYTLYDPNYELPDPLYSHSVSGTGFLTLRTYLLTSFPKDFDVQQFAVIQT